MARHQKLPESLYALRNRPNQLLLQKLSRPVRVLMLSANPVNERYLSVDQEYKILEESIKKTKYRDQIEFKYAPALSPDNFPELVDDFKPNILHFSLHSSNTGSNLVLQNPEDDTPIEVDRRFIASTISKVGKKIICVTLNACYSDRLAQELAQTVACVIGMSGTVLDSLAIKFSQHFYHWIGEGKSVEEAAALAEDVINSGAKKIQVLIKTAQGVDAHKLYLVKQEDSEFFGYLNYMTKRARQETPFLQGSLKKGEYKNRRAVFVNTNEEWSKDDDEIIADHSKEIKDEEKILEDFIQASEDKILVIGAPFGVGKTSLATRLAMNYASKYLQSRGKEEYVPLLVFLKDGINNVFEERSHGLESLIENVISRDDTERKILLVLDGLDEYTQDPKKLMDEIIRTKFGKYRNMKIIITTRLNAGFPEILGINNSKYLRFFHSTSLFLLG